MKKILSTTFLVVVFTFYTLSKRTVGTEISVLPPSSQQPVAASSASNAQASSAFSSTPTTVVTTSQAKIPVKVPPPVPVSAAQPPPEPPPMPASAIPPPPPIASSATPVQQQGPYKNGTYVSPSVDAYFGNVQIQVTIQNGLIADVAFLDYPQDRGNSVHINTRAMPILKTEAIRAQSAPVDIVSGATAMSDAFNTALRSVIAQARH